MAGITIEELSKHDSASSCWIVLHDNVYDLTDFLSVHPGGKEIILKYAGKDATTAYDAIHPKMLIESHITKDKHLGPLAGSNLGKKRTRTRDELRVEMERRLKPPIQRVLSMRDIENVARSVLSFRALSYYAAAGDDEATARENERAYSRFFFIPRVMRPVFDCNLSTKILGFDSPIPLFVSAAALAALGHPLGEINITRGAGKCGIIQMVSTNASYNISQLSAAKISPTQVQFFQLYKKRKTHLAEKLIREAEGLGYKAIFLTVDAPVAGNRERDIRSPWMETREEERVKMMKQLESELEGAGDHDLPPVNIEEEKYEDQKEEVGGFAGELLKHDDLNLSWEETIPWLRRTTKLPIVIKGVQSVSDAVLAAEAGVDGILISNHGGRQLDYSMPTIEVLHRLRTQRPDVFDKLEVFIDGGIRRGTDILKALCLGAKAVGLGRPFLYAQSAYGEAGVVKLIRILEKEILTGMRLLGARDVEELVPEMVERVDFQARSQAKL